MFGHIQFVMNAKLIIHRELNIFEGRKKKKKKKKNVLMWEDGRPCIFTFIWNILIVVLMLNLQAIGWVYIKKNWWLIFKKLIAEGFFNNANSQLRNLATPQQKQNQGHSGRMFRGGGCHSHRGGPNQNTELNKF